MLGFGVGEAMLAVFGRRGDEEAVENEGDTCEDGLLAEVDALKETVDLGVAGCVVDVGVEVVFLS